MTLPKPTLTRIEADAKVYSEERNAHMQDKKYIHKKTLMFYAYQAGAKKEVERAQELADVIMLIYSNGLRQTTSDAVNKALLNFYGSQEAIDDAIAKYKEVTSG